MLWVLDSQVPPSMGFSRQEYWNGLPLSSPGNLPKSGIKLRSPASQAGSLLSEPPVNPKGSPRGGLVLGYNSQSRVPQEWRLKPDPSWKPHPPPVQPIPCLDSRTLLQVPPEAHSPSTTGTGIPVASSTQRNSFLRHLPDTHRDGIQKLGRRDIIWHPLPVESEKKWYKWTYLQNRKRLTDLENELIVAGPGGIIREFGMDMDTLLYLKWISKEYHIAHDTLLNVMYSTWNCSMLCGSLEDRGG